MLSLCLSVRLSIWKFCFFVTWFAKNMAWSVCPSTRVFANHVTKKQNFQHWSVYTYAENEPNLVRFWQCVGDEIGNWKKAPHENYLVILFLLVFILFFQGYSSSSTELQPVYNMWPVSWCPRPLLWMVLSGMQVRCHQLFTLSLKNLPLNQ